MPEADNKLSHERVSLNDSLPIQPTWMNSQEHFNFVTRLNNVTIPAFKWFYYAFVLQSFRLNSTF